VSHPEKNDTKNEQLTTQHAGARESGAEKANAMEIANETLYLKSVCISLDGIEDANDAITTLRAMADELAALNAAANLDDVNWDQDCGHEYATFLYSTTDEDVARRLDFDEMIRPGEDDEDAEPEPTPWRVAEQAEEDARIAKVLATAGVDELNWWTKYVVQQAETHKRLGTKEDFKKYYVVDSSPLLSEAKKASEAAMNEARERVHEVAAKIRQAVQA